MAITNSVLNEFRQQKPEKDEKQRGEPALKGRPLHGMYHWQRVVVADTE